MKKWLSNALLAPVFPDDEEKNHRARILHYIILISLPLMSVVIPIMAFSHAMRPSVIVFDIGFFLLLSLFYFLLRRGKVDLVGTGMVFLAFVWVSLLSASQGTIRAPSTAYYIAVVVLAGLYFEWRGVVISVLASSLSVLGLILAENAGLLPAPDYSVTLIQWITFTIVFFMTGFLSIFSSQAIRQSLKRAQKEIADRARVEMELRKLIRAVEQSPASIVITNLEGEIEYVNPRFCQVTGYTQQEAIGQNPRILKTEQTPAGTHVDLWGTLTAGKEWRGEFVNRKKDGSVYYESATISPIINPEGVTTHYLAVKEDITERKRVEEALRQSTDMYRLLAENISDVIWILDINENRFRYISPSVERLRGYTAEEVMNQGVAAALTPESLQKLSDNLSARLQAFEKGERTSFIDEIAQPCKDGRIVWTETTTVFQVNEKNGHLEVYGVSREITDRKFLANQLQLRLQLMELSSDHSLNEFLEIALDMIAAFTGSSIGFYHFVEVDQKTLTLQAWSTRTLNEYCKAEGSGEHYPIDQAGVWVECLRVGKPVIHNDYASHPYKKGLPPGHAALIRELVVPVYRADKVVSILGVGNKLSNYTEKDVEAVSYLADVVWEISSRKLAEQNLSELQSRLTSLGQNLEDAGLYVYSHDAQGQPHFEYLSPGMEVMTGVSTSEAIRDPDRIHSLLLPEYRLELQRLEEKSRQDLEKFEMEFQQHHARGSDIRWMLLRSTPRQRADGSTVWYGVQMDITARKNNEQMLQSANEHLRIDMQKIENLQTELRDLSVRDPLTGVYNRRYLSETLAREMARVHREKSRMSFIMADIDHFKRINDTYGHQVGDRFLIAVVNLMKNNSRESDIVCRYGGEEFLVVLPGTTIEAAAKRAEEIREKVADLIIQENGKDLRVTVSFGVATFPDHGEDAEEVISKSDKALYRSKESGRNRVTVFREMKIEREETV